VLSGSAANQRLASGTYFFTTSMIDTFKNGGAVLGFGQNFGLGDAIGSHVCWFGVGMLVSNSIILRVSVFCFLTGVATNYATLKVYCMK
jgi:hypothetical protein